MNKKSLITIAIISIFMLSGHAVVAWAGTKPSPVQSEIKQLYAVEKSLNKINARLLKILDNPPDDTMPSPNVNGAVGRLGAMYHHLLILNGFIDSSIEVLGNSPSDSEGMTALEGVGVAAQRISGNIDEYLENANTPEEFIVNLNFVKKEADYIVSNSTTNPTVQCSSYENQKDCEVAECSWLESSFPGGTGSCQASQ
jgi:hypothetical protein